MCKRDEKIYLAIPYTGVPGAFAIANKIAAELLKEGKLVFSPISHSHPMVEYLPKKCNKFDFWEKLDKSFIDWCDKLMIVMLPGWEQSIGVQKELRYARDNNKLVCYRFVEKDVYENALLDELLDE